MKRLFNFPISKKLRRDITAAAAVASLLLLALGVLATYIFAHAVDTQHKQEFDRFSGQQLRSNTRYIDAKLTGYAQLLLTGATVVNVKGSANISRDDWSKYYQSSQVRKNFPEVLGLGYTQSFGGDQLDSITNGVRAEGYPDFTVHPQGDRETYTAITYIEPFNEVNKRAFGYDMFTDQVRQKAMSEARDTAAIAMTSPVVLKQDEAATGKARPQSVLLYYPVYSGGDTPPSVEQRRQSLVGYVYIAVRMHDMLQARQQEAEKFGVNYVLTDVTAKPEQLLHSRTDPDAMHKKRLVVQGDIAAINRTWSLTLYIYNTLEGAIVSPATIFTAGIGSSVVLGGFVFSLLKLRIGRVRLEHETELQKTKDDLLALASHQLRTPATSVRQYTSMLAQGYFGELSEDQKAIIDKAYRANDRQLEIIDQLLYVAKADAGQLTMQYADFDIVHVTKEVIDGFRAVSSAKKITMVFEGPPKLTAYGDVRFIRMIIENLISNAIKYSYASSNITITAHQTGETIELEVDDTGVGIPEQQQAHLFKKFTRIQNPLSSSEGGSGLGLYLAQKLAKTHGGEIRVISDAEQGSTFTLQLPKKTDEEENVVQLTD